MVTILQAIPRGFFDDAQAQRVDELGRSLSSGQALWLSGYLAGLHAGEIVAAPTLPPEPLAGARTLTILHVSETGNGAKLAAALADRAKASGLAATLVGARDYKQRTLKDEQDILLIVSTHGEGDPPELSRPLFEFLASPRAPKLDGVRYAVLALGDSSYEFYCGAGRTIDDRLAELGATRIADRVECDIDYDDQAAEWSTAILAKLTAASGTVPARGLSSATPAPTTASVATLLEQITLVAPGSTKDTRHLEFDISATGLTYQPGDSLGVTVTNPPSAVQALLAATGLDANEPVAWKGETLALGEALSERLEITQVSPRFLAHWADLSEAEELRALGAEGRHADRHAYLAGHHAIDIVRRFPRQGISPEALIAGFRPLQPRLYSLASSQALVDDEAHICVAPVRYALHGEDRVGVASSHLADRLAMGDRLAVHIQSNDGFRLPADDRPIVMIGAGTGVAPYRAFLQDREATGHGGPAWLFLGERNRKTDFLYQTEWQRWLEEATLTRMDVAFSRDAAAKLYVQHRLIDRADELRGWVEDGANIYLCGDAATLAPDVDATLADILGADRLAELSADRRYQRDVY